MIVILSSSTLKNSLSILHLVPHGHVGVYWRGGALLKIITNPGFHLKMPLVTQYEYVQVTIKIDQVRDIPCSTNDGVMINFEKIEVVNQLRMDHVYKTLLSYGVDYDKTWMYEKIRQEINQLCSSHSLREVYIDAFHQTREKMKDALQGDASGIEIISVYVTRPTIPDRIRLNFQKMEEERLKVLIAVEKQKLIDEIETEASKKMAIIEAEKNAAVNKILMEQKLMENDSFWRQQEIKNQIYIVREKSRAYADFFREKKKAEANKLKLTSEFLDLKLIEAIADNATIFLIEAMANATIFLNEAMADNTTIFFGDKVPNMLLVQGLLGKFLQWVSRNLSKEVYEERLIGILLKRVSRNLLKGVYKEGNYNLSFNQTLNF